MDSGNPWYFARFDPWYQSLPESVHSPDACQTLIIRFAFFASFFFLFQTLLVSVTADEQGRQCIIVKLKLNSKFLLISQPAQTSPLFLFIHAVIQYCLGTFIKIKNQHQTASATSAVFADVFLFFINTFTLSWSAVCVQNKDLRGERRVRCKM